MTASGLPKLRFRKPIISTVSHNIPLKELLDRLDTLSTELSKIDQEKIDVKSLESVKDDLVNKKLIHHKDIGVQSLVSCCLADILRIYAPDAPYTDTQLKDIFKLFIKQFKNLSDQENPYYPQQVYLITRLAEVRSIILITVIENNSKLIEEIFEIFYDINNKFNKKLEPVIADILIEIISEWDSISVEVLKLILNKFLTHNSNSSAMKNFTYSLPFNLTLQVCNANPDRLSRQLTKFFSETLFENFNGGTSNDEEYSIDKEKLIKLHKLSVEIWKYCPEILGSVMGLIDDELNAEDEFLRILSTKTIGEFLSFKNSKLNFTKTHKETWVNWLKKTLDISPQVRIVWCKQAANIIIERPDFSLDELSLGLSQTLIDSDEKIRLTTIKSLSNIPVSTIVNKINKISIINGLIQLSREKNFEIRQESINLLSNIFYESYSFIYEDNEPQEILKLIKQIPSNILNLFYINDKNINYFVDISIIEKIFPFNNDDTKRVERLLNILNDLDEKSFGSFMAFNKRQQQLSSVLSKFIEFCEENNGKELSDNKELGKKIDKTVTWLSVSLPDKFQPAENIKRFMKLNNRRLYYLLKQIISLNSNSSYDILTNSVKEFFNRIQDLKPHGSLSDFYQIWKVLVYRSSLNFFNNSNIELILKFNNETKFKTISQKLIDNISSVLPQAFENHIENLTSSYSLLNLKSLFNIFSKLKLDNFIDKVDDKFIEKLIELTKSGSPLQAKYSLKIIALLPKSKDYFDDVIKSVYPLKVVDEEDKNYFNTHLSVISELFLVDASLVEPKSDEITSLLIKNVLLTNQPGSDDSEIDVNDENSDFSWISNDDLENGKYPNLYAKLLSLKFFTNRLRYLFGVREHQQEEITKVSENVLKLINSIIGNGGEIVSSKNKAGNDNLPTPKRYQTRLRLYAGLCLLKLAKLSSFNRSFINPMMIQRLILLIQDENEQVRKIFIRKLTKYLKDEVISLKFLPLVYFIAFEPNSSLKTEIQNWISFSFRTSTTSTTSGAGNTSHSIVFEKSLTGLVYFIAHHDEFLEYIVENDEENKLKAFTFAVEYLIFYLNLIANEKNISLIYYLANRIKQYRDSYYSSEDYENGNELTSNIYKISDLLIVTINELKDLKSWTLEGYPGKIDLSSELFSSMKSSNEAHRVISTSFIPFEIIKKLKVLVKHKLSASLVKKRQHHSSVASGAVGEAKPKRVKSNGERKYRRKVASDEEDSDEEDELPQEREPERKSGRLSKRVDYKVAGSEDESEEDE